MENNWKSQIRREASLHHMCGENRKALERVESKAEAIALYKKTIDWALEEGYPMLDTIRSEFNDCEDFGIFVDKVFHGEILKDQQVYVFHNCRGVIRTGMNLDKAIIPMMYFANGCEMSVKSSGPSIISTPPRVPLYIFGDNHINAENSEDLECKIYKFETK